MYRRELGLESGSGGAVIGRSSGAGVLRNTPHFVGSGKVNMKRLKKRTIHMDDVRTLTTLVKQIIPVRMVNRCWQLGPNSDNAWV